MTSNRGAINALRSDQAAALIKIKYHSNSQAAALTFNCTRRGAQAAALPINARSGRCAHS